MHAIDIAYRRLHDQRLADNPFGAPVDVMRWSGAVQAQHYGPCQVVAG